jgi:ABC-type transport system involved in multi-copper enzyme maturation permease subunit
MRIFLAGLRKLLRRPASFVSVGLLVGLLGLILIASATVGEGGGGGGNGGGGNGGPGAARLLLTFPGAYDLILSFLLGFGGLIAVIYGAAIAGSEWSWGTLKNAVARGESRARYMLATFGSIVLMIAVGLALSFALGVGLALLAANIAGVSTAGVSDADTLARLPAMAARGWFSVIEQAGLGFAIATLARSQLAGIGAGIAFYFGEGFASIFLPDIIQYMPFAVARAAVDTEGTGGGFDGGGGLTEALPADTALLLVGVWLVGSLLVTVLFTERAEITG